MKICPTCNRQYEGEDFVKCPYDGTNLVDANAAGTDPLIGAQFGDSYSIVRVIGEGGMGRVYEARHVRLSKRYAIKILHPQFNTNPETNARFRREAEAASAIGQENILDVIDFNETPEGVYYIVTEYLEGRSLDRALREDGTLKIPRALTILHQMARALTAAHAHGIVHRDLKPENIFLVKRFESDDFVKVLDFGISKMRSGGDRLTQTGQIIGTPHYMSPEQAQGELNLDHRSDVYSFGAIMYEMFTGRLPYQADTVQQILVKLLTEDPPPPRTRRPDLPPDIEAVILRCMARDPDARYASMSELDQALLALWSAHMGQDAPSPMQVMGLSSSPEHRFPTGPGAGVPPTTALADPGSAPTAYPAPTTGPGVPTPGGVTGPGLGSSPGVPAPTQGWGAAGRATPNPVGQSITTPGGIQEKKKSPVALIVVLLLLVLGGGGAAVWFFVLRDQGGDESKSGTATAQAGGGDHSMDRPAAMRPMDRPAAMRETGPRAGGMRAQPERPRERPRPRWRKTMVLFKAGTFTQGRTGGTKYETPPIKNVKVGGFYLDSTEVSRADYAAYLAGAGKGARSPWGTARVPPKGTGTLPVTNVTWQEAGAYCKALHKRLPTEAEWEYAARGPSHDQLYPWGNTFDPKKVVSSTARPSELQPVHSGQAYGGLYHMIGNAWEWVSTRYKPYPGSKAVAAFGIQYVIRGGGAGSRKVKELNATYRVFNYGHRNPKTKKLAVYKFLGFRCARGVDD